MSWSTELQPTDGQGPDMPRVLWITAEPPDQVLGGYRIREHYLLKSLAARADVHLVVPGHLGAEELRCALVEVREAPCPPPEPRLSHTRQRLRTLAQSVFDPEPSEAAGFRNLLRSLEPYTRDAGQFDLVHVGHTALGPLRRAGQSNPWAITMHQLSSRRSAHELSVAAGRRQAWVLRRDMLKAQRFEAAMARRYDLTFVASQADGDSLPARSVVIPNGIDLGKHQPSPLPREHRVIFTGSFNYQPNVDAALWFCRDVLPRLQKLVPDIAVDLVGQNPVPEVLQLGALAGVAVQANVAEMAPFLVRARVAVVPVRVGSGTRLKAVEAFAAGRPVVGTTLGLEGIDVVDGEHALVADEPEAFATAVARLMADDRLAGALTAAAGELVQRYSWEQLGATFTNELLGLVAPPRTHLAASRPSA